MRYCVSLRRDDCETYCLLHYPCFKENCKLTVTDSNKQQVDLNSLGNLDQVGNTKIFFSPEEVETTTSDTSKRTARVLWIYLHEQIYLNLVI